MISKLLSLSNRSPNEFVNYELEEIKYKNKVYNGVKSLNFLEENWQIITLERLFKNTMKKSLNEMLWLINEPKKTS